MLQEDTRRSATVVGRKPLLRVQRYRHGTPIPRHRDNFGSEPSRTEGQSIISDPFADDSLQVARFEWSWLKLHNLTELRLICNPIPVTVAALLGYLPQMPRLSSLEICYIFDVDDDTHTGLARRTDPRLISLQELIIKWTEAGREIAWEVWNLVKDNATADDPWAADKGKRAFQESWGWDDQGENKKPCIGQQESGDSEGAEREGAQILVVDDDEVPEKKQDTLGTMLMQLGINPDTLGWNEEEDDFKVEILD